jgi:hypothetical protein
MFAYIKFQGDVLFRAQPLANHQLGFPDCHGVLHTAHKPSGELDAADNRRNNRWCLLLGLALISENLPIYLLHA